MGKKSLPLQINILMHSFVNFRFFMVQLIHVNWALFAIKAVPWQNSILQKFEISMRCFK